jgi:ABC-type polar amino acid transport system ATPase subunit
MMLNILRGRVEMLNSLTNGHIFLMNGIPESKQNFRYIRCKLSFVFPIFLYHNETVLEAIKKNSFAIRQWSRQKIFWSL